MGVGRGFGLRRMDNARSSGFICPSCGAADSVVLGRVPMCLKAMR